MNFHHGWTFHKLRKNEHFLKYSAIFYSLLKPVVALFACQCLVLIRPLARKIGSFPFLILTFHTLFYPIQNTVGAQFEVIGQSLMGTAVGVTWGIITKLFATAANRNHGDGSPILATSLALASFICM